MDLESKANLKVLPVFVTLDPQRDNPSHLGAYLKGKSYTPTSHVPYNPLILL